MLAKAGVAPKVAMDLMRHSNANLTMGLYSHTVLQDRADALEKLPLVGMETARCRQRGQMTFCRLKGARRAKDA